MKIKIIFALLFLLSLVIPIDSNISNNIHYPDINNEIINNYIDNVVSNSSPSLFLDYDYVKKDNRITIYYYDSINNKLKYNETSFFLKDAEKEIKEVYYDIYFNKKIDENKKMIAFTFDDGPNYNTSKVIDVLNKYQVKGTFFILGSKIKGNERIIEKMADNNMEIGNHTYSHKLLTKMNLTKINDEINKTNNLIYDIVGYYPSLLRPSYGITNSKIKKNTNMPIILWNLDPLDWKYHDSKKIVSRILNKVDDGDIILLHDIYSATVNALDIVIPKLLEMDYQIVTVTELFYYKKMNLEKGNTYFYAK